MHRIKTAVVGASGYTGSELLRLLLQHPDVNLCAVTSRQEAGKTIASLFPRYRGMPGSELKFIEPDPDTIASTGARAGWAGGAAGAGCRSKCRASRAAAGSARC